MDHINWCLLGSVKDIIPIVYQIKVNTEVFPVVANHYVNPGYDISVYMRTATAVGGFPLGAFDTNIPYPSERLTIGKGERLLLYTDGITEATNEQNELYEYYRLIPDFLAQNRPEKAGVFVADLIAELKSFTGAAPQNDDITVLYLHRLP